MLYQRDYLGSLAFSPDYIRQISGQYSGCSKPRAISCGNPGNDFYHQLDTPQIRKRMDSDIIARQPQSLYAESF